MKNREVAHKNYWLGPAGSDLDENICAVLRAFNIDPDAEYDELRKTKIRWWGPGEICQLGYYHSKGGGIWFCNYEHQEAICHWHGPHPTSEAAREHYESNKPQPEAEYDAGWVEEFYDALLKRDTDWEQDRADLCKEAARRERETEARRADTIVCIANGEDPGGYEDSTAMIAVRALRAERDELLWCNANQKRLLEQYQARLRERQPPADLAGIVERMQDLREKRVSDPDIWMLCNAVIDLAQAVAGMGGKP